MADGVRIAHWDTASHLMAIAANWKRRKGTQPFRPEQFHPYRQRRRPTFAASLRAIAPPQDQLKPIPIEPTKDEHEPCH